MTNLTRDPIFPLYVPTERLIDLTSPEVNAPTSNVQDAPKSLTAPRPELIVLIAQLPVSSALRLPAALILRSLALLDLTSPMVLHAPVSLLLPKEPNPREHNLLSAVLALKPLLAQILNLSALLVLSAQL